MLLYLQRLVLEIRISTCFQKLSFYYTSLVLKDIQVRIKLIRWGTIIQITVNSIDFRKIYPSIAEDCLQHLVTPAKSLMLQP